MRERWPFRRLYARSAGDAALIGLGRFLRWYALLVFYVVYWHTHPWLFVGFWRLNVIYGGDGDIGLELVQP